MAALSISKLSYQLAYSSIFGLWLPYDVLCGNTLESQSYTSDCHVNVKESEKKSQNRNC